MSSIIPHWYDANYRKADTPFTALKLYRSPHWRGANLVGRLYQYKLDSREWPVAGCTREVILNLAKPPLHFNGNLAKGDSTSMKNHIEGLVQERRNALELRLSWTNPSTWTHATETNPCNNPCQLTRIFQIGSSLADRCDHNYTDVIMSAMASQITGDTIFNRLFRRRSKKTSKLAFVRGIHMSPVNSPHKGSVTRKMFLFDDVIIYQQFSR